MEDNVCIMQACGYRCGSSVPSVTFKYSDASQRSDAAFCETVEGAPFDSVGVAEIC